MVLMIDDMIDSIEKIPAAEHNVVRINSIADLYKDERQDSKMPTFALTYQGTYITLMAKGGFTKEMARQIESRYHELYKVSDEWVAARLKEAAKTGYITVAFGLRIRTPLIAQTVLNNSATPWEAAAEGRTAGNAFGQSWCLANNRAWAEFMAKVRAHPEYRTQVRPGAQVHDAGYAVIRDDLDLLLWVNQHLVEAVRWQDHPLIAHDIVKLGGSLGIFHPSWAEECEIPNEASAEIVAAVIDKHLSHLKDKT